MKFEIDFGTQRPIGVVAESTQPGSTSVRVRAIGFHSTEDGSRFIRELEGFPNRILSLINEQHNQKLSPAKIVDLLAILSRDNKAIVFVNEAFETGYIRIARPMQPGQSVYKDDVVDIESLELPASIPADAGVMFLFSAGWRKGFYYDLLPIAPTDPQPRQYDCSLRFAQLFAYVWFQERNSVTESEWAAMFKARLFPFAALKNDTIDRIVTYVRNSWTLDDLHVQIITEVQESAEGWLKSWLTHAVIAMHADFLIAAVKHFRAEDYLSCSSVLIPQLEGILRSYLGARGGTKNPGQDTLADAAVAHKADRVFSPLLPMRFRQYLNRVIFAGFPQSAKPGDEGLPVSRHTVSHGLLSSASLDGFTSAVGLLTLHQLYYCFAPSPSPLSSSATSELPPPSSASAQSL